MSHVKGAWRKLAGVFLGFTLGLVHVPAAAQSVGLTPPNVMLRDPNGVDLMGLSLSAPAPTQSIGSNGSGISRTGLGYNQYMDSLTSILGEDYNTWNGEASGNLTVTYMGSSEFFFRAADGSFSSAETPSPNTLACGYDAAQNMNLCTYTLIDGTVATFMKDGKKLTVPIRATAGRLLHVVKPDGEVLKYYYKFHEEQKCIDGACTPILVLGQWMVTSSLGWAVKYQHPTGNSVVVENVVLLNASIDDCDYYMTVCTPSDTTTSTALEQGLFHPGANAWISADSQRVGDLSVRHVDGHYSSLGGSVQASLYPAYDPTNGAGNHLNEYKVHTATRGGKTWTYALGTFPSGALDPNTVVVTDPAGRTRRVRHNSYLEGTASSLESVQDEHGRVTLYGSAGRYVGRVVQPDATYSGTTLTGGYTDYIWVRGSLTSVRAYPKGGGAPIVSTAEYPTACSAETRRTCNKPTYVEVGGVRTNYIYYDHGGVHKETKEPVNGIEAQTRYTYTQITPWMFDTPWPMDNAPPGEIRGFRKSRPVWRVTEISSCMTMTLATCVGTDDEVKTTISYGPDPTNPTYKNVLPVSRTVSRGDGILSQTTTFSYDYSGNVTVTDGPRPGPVDAVYSFYGKFNRKVGEIGPDPDDGGSKPRPATRTTYDLEGRVQKVEKGVVTGTTQAALDAMTVLQSNETEYSTSTGLPIVARQYDRNEQTGQLELTGLMQTSYDDLLRVSCVAQRLNPAVFASITSTDACVLGAEGPDGADRIVKTEYDAIGAVIKTTSGYGIEVLKRDDRVNTYRSDNGLLEYAADGKGNRTAYTYDVFNRLIKTCYPQAGNGAVPSTTDCDQTGYDAVGRPNLVTLRDNQTIGLTYDDLGRVKTRTGAVAEVFGYNNFGAMTSKTRGGQASAFAFNSLGWLLSETSSLGVVTYGYDPYGRRESLRWPDSFEVTYAYNDAGALTAIRQGGSDIVGFGYDDFGRRTGITRPNGVTTGYAYATGSKLKTLTQTFPTVNGGANPNNVMATFDYTISSQLKSQVFTNAAYGPGAPTSGSLTYGVNGLNQMTSAATSLEYDARGNLWREGSPAVNTYTYDAENRLTNASGVGLSYDAQGRLYEIVQGDATTRQLYDGVNMIAEYDGAGGALLRRFVHGTGTDEPLVWYEGPGTADPRWLIANQQGSIIAVTGAGGAALAINTYDEYGVPGAGNLGRFQYTGQQWLKEAGLYHYKARAYSPRIGRFLQTDPIGYRDGMNWYAYTGNDPINRSDPTGLNDCANATAKCAPRMQEQEREQARERSREERAGNIAEGVVAGKRIMSAIGATIAGADMPGKPDVIDAVRGGDNVLGAVGTLIDGALEIPRVQREVDAGVPLDEAVVAAGGRVAATEVVSQGVGGTFGAAAAGTGPGAGVAYVVGSVAGAVAADVSGAREAAGRASVDIYKVIKERFLGR